MTTAINKLLLKNEKILLGVLVVLWSALLLSDFLSSNQQLHTTLLLAALVSSLLTLLLFRPTQTSIIPELTQQFKKINAGQSESLELDNVPEDIQPLVAELEKHLAMETDRLLQEQNFSSDASHELRTPLAGMRLQAQIAQRTTDDKQREKALANILLAVDRSSRLVEQLLVFSRLTRRRTQAEKTLLDITELCRQTVAKLASKISHKALSLESNFDDVGEITVDANKDQLTALLENILSNALEHSPHSGTLRFNIQGSSPNVHIVIEDAGPGIPDTDWQRVVIPFQKSSDGKQKSTGLGLAICDRIAKLHQGSLRLGNSELGGLLVDICLPEANVAEILEMAS